VATRRRLMTAPTLRPTSPTTCCLDLHQWWQRRQQQWQWQQQQQPPMHRRRLTQAPEGLDQDHLLIQTSCGFSRCQLVRTCSTRHHNNGPPHYQPTIISHPSATLQPPPAEHPPACLLLCSPAPNTTHLPHVALVQIHPLRRYACPLDCARGAWRAPRHCTWWTTRPGEDRELRASLSNPLACTIAHISHFRTARTVICLQRHRTLTFSFLSPFRRTVINAE
jgi:hypothetical protein